MSKKRSTGPFIGIDYGEERTGIALGRNGFVAPLEVISATNDIGVIHKIIDVGMVNQVTAYVVGLPLQADNKETVQSRKVRKFAKLLKVFSKKPVIFQNEYGTTIQTSEEIIASRTPRNKKSKVDHFTAALILKSYFSSQNDL